MILLLCGVIGKFGAILTLIPDPVIGGTLTVVFGMVSAVGISTLKFIDLESTRNLTILGISLILGLMVPQYVNDPANARVINTGKSGIFNRASRSNTQEKNGKVIYNKNSVFIHKQSFFPFSHTAV